MRTIILLFAISMMIVSCDDDENHIDQNFDQLLFGHFYGMCQGEVCVETFLLSEGHLYEDTIDDYLASKDFNFIILPDEVYEQVSDLLEHIPDELLSLPDSTFGCPDCRDQGGIYISIRDAGKLKTWRIDNSKNAIPDYLHELLDKVHEKIDLINKI